MSDLKTLRMQVENLPYTFVYGHGLCVRRSLVMELLGGHDLPEDATPPSPVAGSSEPIDEAFHRLAIHQRDTAWEEVNSLKTELASRDREIEGLRQERDHAQGAAILNQKALNGHRDRADKAEAELSRLGTQARRLAKRLNATFDPGGSLDWDGPDGTWLSEHATAIDELAALFPEPSAAPTTGDPT